MAHILGLTQYDVIRKKALEKIRQESQECATLTALQLALQHELACTEAITQQALQVQEQLNALEHEQTALMQEKQRLDVVGQEINQAQQHHTLSLYSKNTLTQEQQTLHENLRSKIGQWRMIHAQKVCNQAPVHLEQERIRLTKLLTDSQQTLTLHFRLKEQLLALKETAHIIETTYNKHHSQELQKIDITCERLQSDLLNYATAQTDLDRQRQSITAQYTNITQQIENLNRLQQSAQTTLKHFDQTEQQFLKRKSYYQKSIAHANWLTTQLRALEQKHTLVAEQHNPSCPLCEQNLSAARRRFLTDKFETQEQFITHQLNRLSSVIGKLKTVLIAQHETFENLKKEKESYLQRSATIAELTNQGTALQINSASLHETENVLLLKQDEAKKSLARATQQRTLLQTQDKSYLAQNEIYQETQHNIAQLEIQVATHETQKNVVEQTHQQLLRVEQELTAYHEFTTQYTLQESRKQDIEQLILQAKKIKQSLKSVEYTLAQYQSIELRIQQLALSQEQYQQVVNAHTQQRELLLQQKGSLENRLATLETQRMQLAEHQKKITLLQDSISDYEQIANATSKDGIQALLIEDSIPEIEQEANDLLARLTNNQAQLCIESLKDLKGGGTKETLDIKISDSAGIRAYELFSGGEAFRIDFALRIAISKLLARRAGTALQTLIIDEGFGSQDDEGLSHIMDAMYAIQEDFQKIIIVSHLPSMKNQFPVHFIVEKKPSGSRVTVIEQD